MASTTAAAGPDAHRGTGKLIFGIVLAVITFWLFAQTTLNVAPPHQRELRARRGAHQGTSRLFSSLRRRVDADGSHP